MPSPDRGVSKYLGWKPCKQAIQEFPQYELYIHKLFNNAYRYIQKMRQFDIEKKALLNEQEFWDSEGDIVAKENRIDKALKKIQELSIDDVEGEDEEDD